MPDGSASHSDTISGEAADMLGQTHRENAPTGATARTVPTDTKQSVFDRP
jgi:hypothetical protein